MLSLEPAPPLPPLPDPARSDKHPQQPLLSTLPKAQLSNRSAIIFQVHQSSIYEAILAASSVPQNSILLLSGQSFHCADTRGPFPVEIGGDILGTDDASTT